MLSFKAYIGRLQLLRGIFIALLILNISLFSHWWGKENNVFWLVAFFLGALWMAYSAVLYTREIKRVKQANNKILDSHF